MSEVLQIVRKMPSKLGYPWERSGEPPVRVIDPLGEEINLPIELCLTRIVGRFFRARRRSHGFQDVKDVMKVRFRNLPG